MRAVRFSCVLLCGSLLWLATGGPPRATAKDSVKTLAADQKALVGKWINTKGGAKVKGVAIEIWFLASKRIGFTQSKDTETSTVGFHRKYDCELTEAGG